MEHNHAQSQLSGGTKTIDTWAQGNVYSVTDSSGHFVQSSISSIQKPQMLLDATGRIFGREMPQYEDFSPDQFVSVKQLGARGDGTSDDTEILNTILEQWSGCKIIYFDAGTYLITSALNIPAGTQIIGEAWAAIMATGDVFQDMDNPEVAVRVGGFGSSGLMEISNMLFTTRGLAPGAIVMEWNIHDTFGEQGVAGLWDSYIA